MTFPEFFGQGKLEARVGEFGLEIYGTEPACPTCGATTLEKPIATIHVVVSTTRVHVYPRNGYMLGCCGREG